MAVHQPTPHVSGVPGKTSVASLTADQAAMLLSIASCGDPHERGTLNRLAALASAASAPERRLIESLADDASRLDLSDRFAPRYCAFYIARRGKAYRRMRELADDLEVDHSEIAVVEVLRAEALAAGKNDEASLRRALQVARRAAERVELAGAQFLIAKIALALHECDVSEAESVALREEARSSLNQALSINHEYPKYLALKARLEGLEGNFEAALALVSRAVEGEDPSEADHAVRIGDHQATRLEILFRKHQERLRREQRDAIHEVRLAREQVLELMGLLAAVIAFVVTGSQIALTAGTLTERASLYPVMGGVILIIFGAYSVLFGRALERRHAIVVAVGLTLIATPLALAYVLA